MPTLEDIATGIVAAAVLIAAIAFEFMAVQ